MPREGFIYKKMLLRIMLVFGLLLNVGLFVGEKTFANKMPIIAVDDFIYPAEARKKGIVAKVVLQITINIDGSVKNVEIHESSGYDVLDKIAKDTVKKWHFQPSRKSDGKAVMARLRMPITFSIKHTKPPKLIFSVNPTYPFGAIMVGIEGKVILKIMVDIDGSVKDVEIYKSSGYDILDEAAKDCVKQWRFEPAKNSEDEPIVSAVRVPINFDLEKPAVTEEEES